MLSDKFVKFFLGGDESFSYNSILLPFLYNPLSLKDDLGNDILFYPDFKLGITEFLLNRYFLTIDILPAD